MGNNGTVGNGVTTSKLIADSFSVAIDPQVTGGQIWNEAILTANANADVVSSIKHDLYPRGFTAVILLLDGHIALQHGIDVQHFGNGETHATAELNVLICTNGGPELQEKLRATFYDKFIDIWP